MPLDAPDWLREINHTGDVGLHITAPTLPALYERAARGLFRVLTDPESVRASTATRITAEGRDREALMVRWLSELNYHHTVDDVVYRSFAVDAIDASGDGVALTATARREPIDPNRHTIYTEIKAVTFHGLAIQDTDDGWSVQVIFDM